MAEDLARNVAALPYLLAACDIVTVTRELAGVDPRSAAEAGDPADDAPVTGGVVDDPLPVARLYFALDEGLSLSRLRHHMQAAPIRSRWDRMALSGLEDELSMALRALTMAAWHSGIRAETPETAATQVEAWLASTLDGLARYRELLAEIDAARDPDLAMLAVVVNSAGKLLRNVVLAAA